MYKVKKIKRTFRNPHENVSRSGSYAALDPDISLMTRAADGDKDAFGAIYLKYAAIVKAGLLRLGGSAGQVDDLVQEVFARVWQQRRTYVPQASLKAYLYAFATRVLFEQQTQQRRNLSIRRLAPALQKGKPPDQSLARIETYDLMDRVMTQLSDKQRQSLELAFKLNLPPREAALKAGCTPAVFSRRLYEATKRLRELIILQMDRESGRRHHAAK